VIVWAVANQKGGVGKTTTAVTLGSLLARSGKRVLLLDLDPHGSMTSYFGLDPDSVGESVYTLFDMTASGQTEPAVDCLVETNFENMSLMPASTALATLDRQLGAKRGFGLVVLRELRRLSARFDFALLDCPPVLGILMVNALAAAQRLVIPVQTEHLALKGLERMMATLAMVLRARKSPLPVSVVPTMFDRTAWACLEALQVLRSRYPAEAWGSEIPVDPQFREASRAGIPLPVANPDSPGVVAYRRLLQDLAGRSDQVVPPMVRVT
jgi:chromosome partitioning protein